MLLSEIARIKDGRIITKDSDITININVGGEGSDKVKINQVVETGTKEEPFPVNTDGTVYKGYTIQQDDEGKFSVFSVGGVPVATMMNSLEEAMNKINGISTEDGE